ncbi:MAG: hypothetical protein U5K76_00020 [Woeseiaceae bacterium]|nr:hypothetical protein [Woeseiaceae bacterium]
MCHAGRGHVCLSRRGRFRLCLAQRGADAPAPSPCRIHRYRGRGHWTGDGWRWPLAIAGYAIPALGLSIYLHYGYAVDLDGMYSDAVYPEELFRFLPWYTVVAGGIGFAIRPAT